MLNQYVSVYVPGTRDKTIPLTRANQRLIARGIAAKLSAKFGGSTSTIAEGSWQDGQGKQVVERIIIVKSYHDQIAKDALKFAESLANELKHKLSQDSVTVESNDGIEFI